MEADKKEQKQEVALTTKALWLLQGSHDCKRDPEAAVQLLKQAAKANDPEAKWMLGLCFEYGVGTKSDVPHAMNLFKKSPTGMVLRKMNNKEEKCCKTQLSLQRRDIQAIPGVCAMLRT